LDNCGWNAHFSRRKLGTALGQDSILAGEGHRGTNDLMGTVLGFVVAFLATVFADKSSLGIAFAGIMEVTRNSDLSFLN
jgi:hypothetical protein